MKSFTDEEEEEVGEIRRDLIKVAWLGLTPRGIVEV